MVGGDVPRPSCVATLVQVFRRLRYHLETRSARAAAGPPAPSQRTWVHPSELPSSFETAALPPARATSARRFQATVAAAAAALLATGGMLLAAPTGTPPAGATDGPFVATSIAALPAHVRTAADSTIALVIYEGAHLATATAMVLPPGDLAVTTTPLPAGASVLGLRPGTSPMELTVVGADHALGVTVLRLPETVPVTPIGPLEPAVATGGAPTALTALAAVHTGSSPVEFQYAAAYLNAASVATTIGRSTIAVTHGTSLVGVVAGSLVLDAHGNAVAAQLPALGGSSFVPASFLQLLAQRIVLGDTVGHGWLQVQGLSGAGPATIGSVTIGGAAWRELEPGDTILAIDSQPVRTMAEVGSILYTSSPGQPVELTVLRHGHQVDADVRLAAAP